MKRSAYRMPSKECKGCDARCVRLPHLFCRSCFFKIPPDLRTAMSEINNQIIAANDQPSLSVARKAYAEALEKAVEIVRARLRGRSTGALL